MSSFVLKGFRMPNSCITSGCFSGSVRSGWFTNVLHRTSHCCTDHDAYRHLPVLSCYKCSPASVGSHLPVSINIHTVHGYRSRYYIIMEKVLIYIRISTLFSLSVNSKAYLGISIHQNKMISIAFRRAFPRAYGQLRDWSRKGRGK